MKSIGIFVMLSCAYGQEPVVTDSLNDFQEVVESSFLDVAVENDEDEPGVELIHLSENPVDLNSADWKQLHQIPGVSPLTAYRIVSARSVGTFSHVRELLEIEGIDEALYQRMLPFVKVMSVPTVSSLRIRARRQSDLQNRRGFLQGSYAGRKEKLYLRTSFEHSVSSSSKLRGNITVEKDPGELAHDAFRSGFLTASFGSFELTGGDFVVGSGNGHVLARGSAIGRGSTLMLRKIPSVSGYQSANEQRFFRGVALAGNKGQLEFCAFYSNKSLHGTMQNDGSVRLDNSGLFRTASERSRRNVARERVIGGYASLDLEGFGIGFTGYDARIARYRSDRSIGIDLTGKGARWWMKGGVAWERSGSSFSSSVALDPLDGCNVFLGHEVFTQRFSARHALPRTPVPASLSVGGFRLRLSDKNTLSVSAYSESFPQGKQGEGFSESETGAMLETSSKISRALQIDLHVVRRDSPVVIDSPDSLRRSHSVRATQAVRKFRLSFTSGENAVRWSSRIEVVTASMPGRPGTLGFMAAQELRYGPSDQLKVRAKVILFSVEAYDARIFSFESEVPGVLMSRVLTGEGTRSTLSVLWKVASGVDLSASFSVEVRDGETIIGSGLEEVAGDTFGRFTMQIDVRL